MALKKRILYLTTSGVIGGAEKQLLEIARALHADEYEMSVCILKAGGADLMRELSKNGIETFSLGIAHKWQVWKAFSLLKVIRQVQPDILQSWLFFDNICARIAGKLCGVPFIISGQRNVETERSFIRNFVDKITLPLADKVVSNSGAGKSILMDRERVPGEKIKVIYNGIDTGKPFFSREDALSRLELPARGRTVGFVGHLTEQKGVTHLLEAWRSVRARHADVRLIVIGDGPERKALQKQAHLLEISDSAVFLGHKSDAWQYMKIFDVFVLPSLWEGMPNVLLEAMLAEVVVVSSDVGGVRELIKDGETGFLAESGSAISLIEKIDLALGFSEGEKQKIGQNAAKRIKEKFSIEEMIKSFEYLYEDILG